LTNSLIISPHAANNIDQIRGGGHFLSQLAAVKPENFFFSVCSSLGTRKLALIPVGMRTNKLIRIFMNIWGGGTGCKKIYGGTG